MIESRKNKINTRQVILGNRARHYRAMLLLAVVIKFHKIFVDHPR